MSQGNGGCARSTGRSARRRPRHPRGGLHGRPEPERRRAVVGLPAGRAAPRRRRASDRPRWRPRPRRARRRQVRVV